MLLYSLYHPLYNLPTIHIPFSYFCALSNCLLFYLKSQNSKLYPNYCKYQVHDNHLILSGGSVTVWLSSEVSRGATDTTCILQSPLPINSVDVEGTTLIAGSDNEAIYVVHQVLKKRLEDMIY